MNRTNSWSEAAGQNLPPSWIFCLALSLIALFVHGYHPFAEDAGIYIPAIKKLLDPSLYPSGSEIFMLPAHWSVFTTVLAQSTRITHVSLTYVLLFWYLLCLFLTISACWKIAAQSLGDKTSGLIGASLIATTLSMPAAGCALLLFDPYLTSRSVSTPLILFSLSFVLDRKCGAALLCWIAAALFHPLMAAIFLLYLAVFGIVRSPNWRLYWAAFTAFTIIMAFVLTRALAHSNLAVTQDYRAAVMSRSYFFVSGWMWYEWLGALAPLCFFFWLAWSVRQNRTSAVFHLSLATASFGAISILGALAINWIPALFVLARFQPMRAYQLIYLLFMALAVNAAIQQLSWSWPPVRRQVAFASLLVMIACGMYIAQRQTFPASAHIEWPWSHSHNDWQMAFAWIRNNSPKDAVFALNPDYPDAAGNDRQGFRATAERSSLPDRAKDGGVAALFPQIAGVWRESTAITAGLDHLNDEQENQLLDVGATWVVVHSSSDLRLNCPYMNRTVAVCRLNQDLLLSHAKPASGKELSPPSR